MTKFELLPNEVLLDIFKSLNSICVIRAFFGLNIRLNKLVNLYVEVNPFNFQSISKEDFHLICPEYFQLFVDKIVLLRLSNEETPNLSEMILSDGFTLDRFISLKSLSLHYIKSLSTLTKITFQCRSLVHLHRLEIIHGESGETQTRIFHLLDNIWNIPNLIFCNLNGIQKHFTIPSQIWSKSSSMKFLSVKNIQSNFQFLSSLFQCTPNLEHLCSTIRSYSSTEYIESPMSSMITFEASLRINQQSMKNILEKLVNLNNLIIELENTYFDGNQWKELIVNCLPKIKTFRLKMIFESIFDERKEEQIDEILNTFRSSFWLEKYQWFVRCRWNPSDHTRMIILYTLPYAFNSFHYSNEYSSKSTCPTEQDYRFYRQVQSIYQNKMNLVENLNMFDSYFCRINHVSIIIPIQNSFLHCFQSLNTITSLEVFLSDDFHYDQIQTLLHQTHRLYSLQIISNRKVHRGLFHLTSLSIRRLDLTKSSFDGSDYFNDQDCKKLINSSFGLQCEVLLIRVQNRINVLNLIEKMLNLRLIIFGCHDDKNFLQKFSSTNDEFLQRFKDHFPSTFSIVRDQEYPSYIRIWINRQKQIFNNNISTSKDQHKNFRLFKLKFPFFHSRKSSVSTLNTFK